MAHIKETRLVDSNTGEIKLNKKIEVDYFNDDGYLMFAKRNYSRVFSDFRIPKEFSDSELGKIYRLQRCIEKNTNMMFKVVKKRKIPMTRDDLVSETGLSTRLGKDFIKKLFDYGIIGTEIRIVQDIKTVEYYFNPLYYHNSKRLSHSLYKLFKKQLNEHLPKWVKQEFEQMEEHAEKIKNDKQTNKED